MYIYVCTCVCTRKGEPKQTSKALGLVKPTSVRFGVMLKQHVLILVHCLFVYSLVNRAIGEQPFLWSVFAFVSVTSFGSLV